jgi:acetyl-CoA carboxylase biotin carboxyl carrier protein
MDLSYIKKLVKIVSESNVDEIEIEEEGKKVRIAKSSNSQPHVPSSGVPIPVAPALGAPATATPPEPAPQQETSKPQGPSTDVRYHEIKSPIVGTFYRAPAPDASSFVEVGAVIQPGTVLCIVEAMKLMNEIESDVSGRIVKILVENGQPVEYDQVLFLVEKA